MRSRFVGGLALALLFSQPLAAQTFPIPPSNPIAPAEGFWYDPERPGTGFSLEHRGDIIALAFYHFAETAPEASDWHLATGMLEGATLATELLHFSGGSCLGCTPFAPAELEESARPVRLAFQSAREATLQLDEGTPRRVVAMPYGVPYAALDAAPAELPLPDLRGRWLIEGGGASGVLQLASLAQHEDGIEFRGAAHGLDMPNVSLLCSLREDVEADSCVAVIDPLPDFAPAPADIALFRLGDIGEDRMVGVAPDGSRVVAWRIEDAEGTP